MHKWAQGQEDAPIGFGSLNISLYDSVKAIRRKQSVKKEVSAMKKCQKPRFLAKIDIFLLKKNGKHLFRGPKLIA